LLRLNSNLPPVTVSFEARTSTAPPRRVEPLPWKVLRTRVTSALRARRKAPPPTDTPDVVLPVKTQPMKAASAASTVTPPASVLPGAARPSRNFRLRKVTRLPRERSPFLKRRTGRWLWPSRNTLAFGAAWMVNAFRRLAIEKPPGGEG
jgi:hypothetical protein